MGRAARLRSRIILDHPWITCAAIWILVLGVMLVPWRATRRSILAEVRSQAMGVAIAAAAGLSAEDVAEISGPQDVGKPAYARLQQFLDAVALANPDVRYVYVMRRARREGAAPTEYEYVADQHARDIDGDGVIGPAEGSEIPGTPYDASRWPELVRAWDEPTADWDISPDPPYPDLISGYAPVKDAQGRTVAVVGVDITAARVGEKLRDVAAALAVTASVVGGLLSVALGLFVAQGRILARNTELSRSLAQTNERLQRANRQLERQKQRAEQELQLARRLHRMLSLAPPPVSGHVVLDKAHLSCELFGGDLFDAFAVGADHCALYLADVAGRGTEAALVAGLVRTTLENLRRRAEATAQERDLLLCPEKLMSTLNDLLVNQIPDFEFVTMIYAVLDVPGRKLAFANAGHPAAFRFDAQTGQVVDWIAPTGPALGLLEKAVYTSCCQPVSPGDKVIFFSDGVTSVLDAAGQEFGRDRLHRLIEETGRHPPAVITEAIKRAFDAHRNGRPILDDFSLLVAEIR